MSKKITFILKSFVSVLLLSVLFSRMDILVFWNRIKDANFLFIIIAASLFYGGVYFSILRWNLFLRFYGIMLRKGVLFRIYLIGAFLNNFLPSSIGGDGYKLYHLSKKFPEGRKGVVSSILYERGSGFLLLLVINFILFLFYHRLIALGNRWIFILEMLFLGGVGTLILFRRHVLKFLETLSFKAELFNKIKNVLRTFASFNSTGVFLMAIFYSFFFILNAAIGAWLLFLSFDVHVSIFYILFVSTFIQLLGILPISINSIGISEGGSVFLYSIIGIPPEVSLAVALIARISMMITSSVGGLLLMANDQQTDRVFAHDS